MVEASNKFSFKADYNQIKLGGKESENIHPTLKNLPRSSNDPPLDNGSRGSDTGHYSGEAAKQDNSEVGGRIR
jgi:hypothetical protein